MPAVSVSDHAMELIDEYRKSVEWNVTKKEVVTKAIEEFHETHLEGEEGDS